MGNSWIARQEETVVQLDLMGADELALDARKPLASFYAFLAFARERLNYLERKRFGNAPESN
jgi:3-deoxy-D-arabino-heptulosonate 7-phosphate (DAHP) synthase